VAKPDWPRIDLREAKWIESIANEVEALKEMSCSYLAYSYAHMLLKRTSYSSQAVESLKEQFVLSLTDPIKPIAMHICS
jgi:hypothetical protein